MTGVKAFFEDDDFTTSFRSVMAFGRIREVSNVGEFKHALVNLCMKYVLEAKHGIGKAMELEGPHTAVWAIDIDELSGKARSGPRRADAGADAAGACAVAGAQETA